MTVLSIFGLFILGTIFGSLGSVLITRFGKKIDIKTIKGFFFGFSHCPKCKNRLKAQNLIPIVSYFRQNGKCSYCDKPISKFYPTVEILSGLIFIVTFLLLTNNYGLITGNMIFWLIMNRLLLLILIYDFQKYELHIPLGILALGVSLIPQFFGGIGNYSRAFIGSLIFGVIFYGIYYGSKRYVKQKYRKDMEGFGEGDVWFAFLVGTLLPFVIKFNGLTFSIGTIFELLVLFALISSILGIIFYYARELLGYWKLEARNSVLGTRYSELRYLPFLPFMIIAFWILLFRGNFFIKLMFV